MYTFLVQKCLIMILIFYNFAEGASDLPMVISTWAFKEATQEAWKILSSKDADALDAIEGGCKTCEELQCDGTVGFGGSPDESGETTLDAMIFDGDTMNVGAVAGLRRIKSAISVARHVLKYTEHSLLAGDLATQFAKNMGFVEESLSTNVSKSMWREWKSKNCQPNFNTNVFPNPRLSCGPYKPIDSNHILGPHTFTPHVDSKNHDTISMIAIDKTGKIAAGSSSNGAKFKIPGRIGDAPISGAAAFADSSVGAAVATGDGDIMMRFSPSAIIVEMMRNGALPRIAASQMVGRIARYYPKFSGAFIAVNKNGDFFAACNGFTNFTFSRASPGLSNVTVSVIKCSKCIL